TLTITSVTQPAHGTVAITNAGADRSEERRAGKDCTDSCTHTITDKGTTNGVLDAKSDTATVSITVTEVNDSPTAVADSKTLAEDAAATTILVRANAAKGPANEGTQTLTITGVTQPAHGTVAITNAGADLTYTPDADDHAADRHTHTNTDNGTTNGDLDARSDTATVSITVTEANDAPTAAADSNTLAEDAAATTIPLRLHDALPTSNEGTQTLTITGVTQPAHGTVAITNAGADLTYTP